MPAQPDLLSRREHVAPVHRAPISKGRGDQEPALAEVPALAVAAFLDGAAVRRAGDA